MSSLLEQASLVITPNAYKAGKLYGLKGTDLDVVRATTATRVNESGLIETVVNNVPRLDYTNESCPSVLVEPQRTNLSTHSENMGDSSWEKFRAIITDNVINSPSGILNADKFIANLILGTHELVKVTTILSGTVYTRSIFVKIGEYNTFQMYEANSLKGQMFNLSTKTISAPQTTGVTAATSSKIEDYGNGWLKCSITYTSVGVVDVLVIGLHNNSLIFAGDNTSGLHVWGAQLEASSYPTSYIPTVATASTRNADVISKTGIADLIGQTEGTVFVDFNRNSTNEGGLQLGNSDGPNDYLNSIILQWNVNGVYTNIFVGGATQFSNTSSSVTGRHKLAVVYKANDFALYIDGVQIATDSSGSVPSLAAIFLNHQNFGLTGTNINTSVIWKTRLTNAELATLTTL